MSARTFLTKSIRPLSKVRINGKVVSPTEELRRLKPGRFLLVDDAESRRRITNAAHRLNIPVKTRKQEHGQKYEIHRLEPKPVLTEFLQ